MEEIKIRYDKAIDFMNRKQFKLAKDELNVLTHQPLNAAYSWLVCKAMADCCYELGQFDESAHYYGMVIHRFRGADPVEQRRLHSNYLFLQHYLPDIPDKERIDTAFQYAALYDSKQCLVHGKERKRQKPRLRIGYLSPDFSDHVDMFFFIQLLACRQRERYEVVCYSLAEKGDDTTEQIRALSDGWRELSGLSTEAAAQCIYGDQVDILFDLSAHTFGGITLPVTAFHPAPVQLCGIGYMSTTGLSAVDYFLTDVYCDPPGCHEDQFSEKLLRLPHSHFCYTPSQRAQQAQAAYDAYELHDGCVFGSFNNFAKISDEMLELWLQIVQRVPGSRLLLKNPSRKHWIRSIQKRAAKIGFQPEQLEIQGASGDYFARYPDMDIMLDTYPYTGGGTTCDALYMGVPVISLYGERHGSRFGYSLLQNIGLGELACASKQEYIEKAAALGRDRELIRTLHKRIRPMMQQSPVMDGPQYTREVEAAYEQIWQTWLET